MARRCKILAYSSRSGIGARSSSSSAPCGSAWLGSTRAFVYAVSTAFWAASWSSSSSDQDPCGWKGLYQITGIRWDSGIHSSSERYSPVSRDSSHSSVSLAVSLDSYLFMENPTTELQEYDAPYVVSSLSRGGMKSLRVNFLTTLEALGRDSSVAPSEAVEEVSTFSGTSCFV